MTNPNPNPNTHPSPNPNPNPNQNPNQAGINDKFAYGMRGPMRVYLRRAADIVVAQSNRGRNTKPEP